MVKIQVGIGHLLYEALEGVWNWKQGCREIPLKKFPVTNKPVNADFLNKHHLDSIFISENGLGAAIGKQNSLPAVFITQDGGNTWRANEFKIRSLTWKWRKYLSGSYKNFDALTVSNSGLIAVTWNEEEQFPGPWSLPYSKFHLFYSSNSGRTWGYHQLGNGLVFSDWEGQLLTQSGNYLMASADGKKWQKNLLKLEVVENQYGKKTERLRNITFVQKDTAYALVVHLHELDTMPPNIVLIKTTDNGINWRYLKSFPGPTLGHVNQKHMLSLTASSSL